MPNRLLDSLHSLHCLIVDDDPVFLPILQAMLADIGVAEISCARNGSEALDMIANPVPPIDVVLCDMWMPAGNGLQVLKAIRTGQVKSARLDLCFIMISGNPLPEPIKAAAKLDACGFLVKPLSPDRLRSAIINGRKRYFSINPVRYADVVVA